MSRPLDVRIKSLETKLKQSEGYSSRILVRQGKIRHKLQRLCALRDKQQQPESQPVHA